MATLAAALLLAGCGGADDDKENDSAASQATEPKTETGTTKSTGSPQDNARAKEITACLKQSGLNVIVNPGGAVESADYQLVINSGGAGVRYGSPTPRPRRPASRRCRSTRAARSARPRRSGTPSSPTSRPGRRWPSRKTPPR